MIAPGQVSDQVAQPAATRDWIMRQPLFWVLFAIDLLVLVAVFVGYMLTKSLFAFAPMVVFAPIFAFGMLYLAKQRPRASAEATPGPPPDPIVR